MVSVVIFDAFTGEWLRLEGPAEVVAVYELQDVVPALEYVEHAVNTKELVAAGFISYEAAPAFDRALHVRLNDGKFPLLWFGLFEREKHNNVASSGSTFRLPNSRRALPSPVKVLHRPTFFDFHLPAPLKWNPSVTEDEYVESIKRIKSYIKAGDTYQVNYSFRLLAPFSGDAYEYFLQLYRAQPTSNCACIVTDDFAICSASPELFFSLDGRSIVTRPMKGTAPRGLTLKADKLNAESLRTSEKNRAENVMIVDMMRNDLGRVAETGTVQVPALFDVERHPTVWQMTSTVTAKTDASVTEIMKALFPCASVTGAPKARTMEIIAQLESTPRRIYTGTIGFIAPHRQAQFNVAIRTVLIDQARNVAEYGVGGGVVWGSTAEGEYDECLMKARVLTEHKPGFALFETILYTSEEGFFLLDEHLTRMNESCEYFDYEYMEDAVAGMLEKLRQGFSRKAYRIRIEMLPTGLPTLSAEPIDVASLSAPARVRLAKTPVDSKNVFLYHKTTNRTMYEDALTSVYDCEDVILWNERGEITESTIANVAVEIDGELCTPPVECGLLAGTFRAALVKEKKLQERIITTEELKQAPKIFLINSLRKWREVQLLRDSH
jgi:para-aminobenzoate synthetase/4-amino-4-deoxychorismate lyase